MKTIRNDSAKQLKKNMYLRLIGILKLLAIIFTVFLCYYISCIFMNNNKSSAGDNIKTNGFFDFNGMLKDLTTVETIGNILDPMSK